MLTFLSDEEQEKLQCRLAEVLEQAPSGLAPGCPSGCEVEVKPLAKETAATVRKGLALAVIMIGVLIAAVDTTIVILALPTMRADLHVGFASVIWIVLGYLLVITLLATQVGRLGDMFGRVRMYEMGFAVFVVGSVLCALSWNEASIVAFRILQGVGGAFISANSGAIIADIFPPNERGRAYGYNSIGWNAGAVVGILAGGLLVTFLSWRWIFWINVPIGIVALVVAFYALPADRGFGKRGLDVLGMATLGAALFSLLYGMVRLTSSSLNPATTEWLVGGLVLLFIFVLVERATKDPMVHLSLFRVPMLTPSFLASFFQGLANFAVLFLITMYLQGVRALSPLDAALLLIPGYLVGSATAPISGRLADLVGPVIPATVGLAIQVVALLLYAQLGVATPLWAVSAISMVNGLGSGGFFPANSSAVMKVAPPGVFGLASGMLRTFQNVGMVFSFSMALLVAARAVTQRLAFQIFVGTTVLSRAADDAFLRGIHAALYASVAAFLVAAVLSGMRGVRRSPGGNSSVAG
ncbi:MAG: MFS transporter [Thermaerobacter sp.]|nr:MFS transporter [Thermaerobacter sp.]